jgi:hypothetical protein
MMKFFISMLLVLLCTGCSADSRSGETSSSDNIAEQAVLKEVDLAELSKAIALAKQNKDYRFLVTSGRSMSIPGVDIRNFQTLIELCGTKYNAKAGDVITSPEQRLERKRQIEFMRQYNEQMFMICQENNMK